MNLRKYLFVVLGLIISPFISFAEARSIVSGRVISDNEELIEYAAVYLKGTEYSCMTNEQGLYHLHAPEGKFTLVVYAAGYEPYEVEVRLENGKRLKRNIFLQSKYHELGEVEVVSSEISRIKKSPFNVVAVETKEVENSTKNLSDLLTKLPGMKIRETGGVGSETQMMLDGFSGKHIKVFIDGVPQEGVGSSFSVNNIPVNFAERIEVYKGVVPVEFGTDALGGVVNIVTNKNRRRWFLDASYSYGSFNTHKSYVNFGNTFKSGLSFEVNAFQNYSDNDYYINTYVTKFNEDGSEVTDSRKIERVKRFNDMYHNEAVVGKVGIVGKKFADRLMFGVVYSNMYKEIQTGVRQEVVFGGKHRKGYSVMPSLEYVKRNLLGKKLDMNFTANYNYNLTQNIDTLSYKYNWYGDRKFTGIAGEQAYQDSELRNKNWNASVYAKYRLSRKHSFSVSHVQTFFSRDSRSNVNSNVSFSDFTIPKKTWKSVTGISYRLLPSSKWNISVFGKHYFQRSAGPVSKNSDGVGNYVEISKTVNFLGYGFATSYAVINDLQARLSYEKSCRLPSNEELFGDEDLEAGKVELNPEKSDNINLNISYSKRFGKHIVYVEGGLIYRYTRDYIKRGISKHGSTYYGSYENHGKVETKGFNISGRYGFSHWLSLGGTFSRINMFDDEKFLAGGSTQESLTYGTRLPNQPYQFANYDVSLSWKDLFGKGNKLILSYDSYYQYKFPLYWENIGDSSSKKMVPTQFSHNLGLTYSLDNGKYNLSLECKNFTNEALYDNFSLQKAGRAFYAKFRFYLGN